MAIPNLKSLGRSLMNFGSKAGPVAKSAAVNTAKAASATAGLAAGTASTIVNDTSRMGEAAFNLLTAKPLYHFSKEHGYQATRRMYGAAFGTAIAGAGVVTAAQMPNIRRSSYTFDEEPLHGEAMGASGALVTRGSRRL